jgi:hypothetical protein
MLPLLRETNPAKIWLREKFQTSLSLVNEQHIVIRFDLASCGSLGFIFDTDKVMKFYGDVVLADKGIPMSYEEHTSICSAIADTLNDKMQLVANDVLGHIRMSFDVLDALSGNDDVIAYQTLGQLATDLMTYNPQATKLWSPWCNKVCDMIEARNEPGFDVEFLM